jgi:hypothetical protein
VPSGRHQLDLCGAVEFVLAAQRDMADRGAVREQDEEVVAIVVVAVALDAFAHRGQ